MCNQSPSVPVMSCSHRIRALDHLTLAAGVGIAGKTLSSAGATKVGVARETRLTIFDTTVVGLAHCGEKIVAYCTTGWMSPADAAEAIVT